jgi:hypothetical protein
LGLGKLSNAAADVRNVGKTELCALYNYGEDDTAVFVFPAGGNNFQQAWQSGKGGLAWLRILVESAKPMSSPPLVVRPPSLIVCRPFQRTEGLQVNYPISRVIR